MVRQHFAERATAVQDLLPVTADEQRTDAPVPTPIETHPIEDHTYIEIRPSDAALDPQTVSRGMNLLFEVLAESTQDGWLHSLKGTTQQPLAEWLLVGDGRPDTQVRYFLGSQFVDLLEDLEGVLRTCFPNSYEIRAVEWHPRRIHELLPVAGAGECHPHPAITPARPYVAGVEYCGHAERRFDWQTPLVPFDAVTESTRATDRRGDRNGSRRVPLATLVEAIQDAEVPVIYQAVCHPSEDWSRVAEDSVLHKAA